MNNKKIGVGVGVMLLKDAHVLLGKRHSDPTKADSALHGEGTWTMPGGSFHFGESFETVAVRETQEETGIKLDPNTLKVISLANDVVEDAHFITIGLLCEKIPLQDPKVMEPDEIVEWQWFHLDDLPSPLFFPSEKIIKNYRAGEFYKY